MKKIFLSFMVFSLFLASLLYASFCPYPDEYDPLYEGKVWRGKKIQNQCMLCHK